ncbi:MAG TPA: hypothetical protein VLW88_13875 [Hyphomicrobium sp.]|nr:hypothetical protein [Hyphomicrobium sp.]
MVAPRALRWLAFAPVALAAASAPALAVHVPATRSTIAGTAPSPAVMVAGRKGTRNYAPDDAGSAAAASESSSQEQDTEKARLDQCLASWDKGTHISQSSWRQICVREIKSNE